MVKVLVLQNYPLRDVNVGRREVPDRPNPSRHHQVGHGLRGVSGRSNDPQRGSRFSHEVREEEERLNFRAMNPLADLFAIDIECRDNLHAVASELLISEQGTAQTAGTHQDGGLRAAPTEKVLDPTQEVAQRIADARFADDSGHFDIFADQGRIEVQHTGKVGAGNYLGDPSGHHVLQAPIIYRQSAETCFRYFVGPRV